MEPVTVLTEMELSELVVARMTGVVIEIRTLNSD